MKKLLYVFGLFIIMVVSCTSMDDNFKHFLDEIPVYSPRVDSISAKVEALGEVKIFWLNPASERAKTVTVAVVDEDEIAPVTKDINRNAETLLDSVEFKSLPLKGLEFRVTTTDSDNNTSAPVSINVNPIP